jgi:hypothetical protein
MLERAIARGLDELGARSCRRFGADDRDTALQRVRGAVEAFAIAAAGGFSDGFHLP